tara:strand:- start:5657 stop:6373 length:717 start_codon:yes stop_codon:yes gene_type:complete
MGRNARKRAPGRVIALLLPFWVAGMWYGWGIAANNPSGGWSLAMIWLGAAGSAPIGSRAELTDTGWWVSVDLTGEGLGAEEHLRVIVRRDRVGLFAPWLETTDLEALSASASFRDLRTGSTDPRWKGVLRAAHPFYASAAPGAPAAHAIAAGIDDELAGRLPARRINWPMFRREAAVLGAYAMLSIALVHLLGAVRRRRLVLERRSRGVCLNCGYAHSGVLGTCPECGVRMRRRYHYP